MRLLLLLATLLLPCAALAQERLALVIGNDGYRSVPVLQKARADAEAISETLARQGFETVLVRDADRREMNREIARFTGRLAPGDTALVFFAGHGVEIDGENYLLPTDIVAPAAGETDFVKSESIALSDLLDRVRASGARTTLAIIDACRDNPFATSTGRSIGTARGLGRITAPEGTFVIFSAGAGQLALDRLSEEDGARNSVFTRLLLPRLRQPGLELRAMMADLRREVRDLAQSVGHDQFPAYYDELLGSFYFVPAAGESAAAPAPAPSAGAMRADFELARSIGTAEAYGAFLDTYGAEADAFPVQMAMRLRDALRAEADPDGERGLALVPTDPPAPSDPVLPRDDVSAHELIRRTQAQLNALGCDAGGADGIVGRRTRAAFQRFLDNTASGLTAGDLGSARALAELEGRSGTVCVAVAAPVQPPSAAPAPRETAPATPVYSMTGTWRWTANCPLGRISGTASYGGGSGGRYSGTIVSDNGGPRGSVTVTLQGRSYSATERFGLITNRVTGTLSADGRSLTSSVSNGCRVTARKQ